LLAGARILKTGLAVMLSMIIVKFLNVEPALFAGAATVLNMQPSVGQSFLNAREQIYVHFLAISIAVFLGLTLGPNPVSMGLAAILVIYSCNKFTWKSAISGGVMASIFILGAPSTEFLGHALTRSIAIFIGVGTALVVNLTIAPPRYRQPLIEKLLELNQSISDTYIQAILNFLDLRIMEP